MAYFRGVVARNNDGWAAPDVDLATATDLESLTALLRGAAGGSYPSLLVVDREDEWFGIVRVDDDDEDARVFVSDADAAASSPYAELLGVEATDESLAAEPVGDFEILADLGTSPERLRALCDGELGTGEADALTAVAEAAGFDVVLDAIR